MDPYYVYILQSQRNGQYYIGVSKDPQRRLKGHNRGNTRSTKHKKPLTLVFSQKYSDQHYARRIEYKLKHLKRRDYLEKIIKDKVIKL